MKEKGLFLDLDHTLIQPWAGGRFPKNPDDWEVKYENVIPRIHSYMHRGYKLIVVSNQGGVETNFITREELARKIKAVRKALQKPGTTNHYIHFYWCETMESFYRKPNPGMAYEASLRHEIHLGKSIMVGDMSSDREFAANAGIGHFVWAEDFFNVHFMGVSSNE